MTGSVEKGADVLGAMRCGNGLVRYVSTFEYGGCDGWIDAASSSRRSNMDYGVYA